jgi:RNA polymerase sigma factor (sigma-70 family)
VKSETSRTEGSRARHSRQLTLEAADPFSGGQGSGDKFSDKQLLEMIRGRDSELSAIALRQVYDDHIMAYVLNYVGTRIPDEQEAQDAVGDICEVMVKKLPDFEWTGVPIRHWVSAIARRVCDHHIGETQSKERSIVALTSLLEYWRGNRLDGASPVDVIDQIESAEVQRAIYVLLVDALRGLNQHSPRCYKVIILSFFRGLSGPQIANQLGLTQGAVRKRKHDGIQYLRDSLQPVRERGRMGRDLVRLARQNLDRVESEEATWIRAI